MRRRRANGCLGSQSLIWFHIRGTLGQSFPLKEMSLSGQRFPDLFEAFWNLPTYIFGKPNHWIFRALVWLYRAGVIAAAIYITVASVYYNWTRGSQLY